MPETGSNASSTTAIIAGITKWNATILAGQNSITVTHNLGRVVKVTGVFGLDDNANVFIVKNEGVNSFDVALFGGILAGADTTLEGAYA